MYKNNLDESKYLVKPELQEVLSAGRSLLYYDKESMVKAEGVYFVCFRLLKKDSKVLIYNYLYYPYDFGDALMCFLFEKKDFKNSLVFSE
jgi:hypothetical protein